LNGNFINNMKIYKEKAGIISEQSVWVCINNDYLYISENLLKLIWILLTEWNNDKHLVG